MLSIVCGEDTASSRNYYQALREQYKLKGYELVTLNKSDFEHPSVQIRERASLFFNSQVFFSENLVKFLKRHKSKALLEEISGLVADPGILWIDWEEYAARDIANPKKVDFKEFKLPLSIFQFLESVYPGNLAYVVRSLDQISGSVEEGFIYSMLCRHIRSLLTATTPEGALSIPVWQRHKLQNQAKHWPQEKLLAFYSGLARLDSSMKTSSNAYGIRRSLEVLLLYFI